MYKPKVSLDVYENFISIKDNNNNIVTTKNIAIDSLKSIFSGVSYKTPIFPAWVVYYKHEGIQLEIMTCRYFGDLMPIKMISNNDNREEDFTLINIQMPYVYMLWQLTESEGSYRYCNVHAYASFTHPSEETNLYVPKLPNVYNAGTICWGSYHDLLSGSFERNFGFLLELEELFFTAIHSDHIVNRSNLTPVLNIKYASEAEWAGQNLVYNGHSPIKLKELYITGQNNEEE